MKNAILFGTVCLMTVAACGGDSFTAAQSGGIEGSGGEGGEETTSSSESGTGGQAGDAQTSSGTGGSGGSSSSDSTTATTSTTGDATSTTGSGCIPKTCVTVAVEMEIETDQICGPVSDGCGNYIDCGGCSEPYQECGGAKPYADGNYVVYPDGVQNVCGGGCIVHPLAKCTQTSVLVVCSTDSETPPFPQDCIPQTTLPTASWCCG